MTPVLGVILMSLCCAASAQQPQGPRDPHVGYVYPAGAQQGTNAQMVIGGQFLRGVSGARVSGSGVRATVVRWAEPLRPLNGQQMRQLQQRVQAGRQGRTPPPLVFTDKRSSTSDSALPDHPLLREVEKLPPDQLEHVIRTVFNPKRRQMNQQIGETVIIDVAIDGTAAPGDREIRLMTPNGLSNPLCFQVGRMVETREQEPNDASITNLPVADLPVTINGQVFPGDVDRFRFRARSGQRLVIEADARHLIPYLADAVPGWFQATLAVYDSTGKELAYDDDYRFDPDPVLLFQVPADGEYYVQMRDSIYRGREDFVYRITIAERPFITGMYPLGGRAGEVVNAWVAGWNLPWNKVQLQTSIGPGAMRQAQLFAGQLASNLVSYAVDALPETFESEPNEKLTEKNQLALPQVVNGYIAKPGDVDTFAIRGKAGERIVAEIQARRFGSPLDGMLRLRDSAGRLVASNDDAPDRENALQTHHADSRLTATLPRDGEYAIEVSDAQGHGGPVYGYRLRVGPPQPDFALRVTPASVNLPAGRTATITLFAMRKDAFDGDIEVALAQGGADFELSGARIPAGRDHVRMTLTALRAIEAPVALSMEGRADIDGKRVVRDAVPAEDMMQAFAYRHLVPAQELLVAPKIGSKWGAPIELASGSIVQVPAGGKTQVNVRTPKRAMLLDLKLELSDPPKGITLEDVSAVPGGMVFSVKAAPDAKVGPADNLIVEAFASQVPPAAGRGRRPAGPLARLAQTAPPTAPAAAESKPGNAPDAKRKVSLGVLPAIPFQISRQ